MDGATRNPAAAPLAGIVLVNYGTYAHRFLAECRDSLRQQNYPGQRFRVYLVDNASTPDSRAFLEAAYPEARTLARGDGNYCAANNAGIAAARADGCEVLVIANMDTRFDPRWLAELVAAASPPEVGLAQSKILLYPKEIGQPPRVNTLGNRLHFLGFGFTQGYGEPDRPIEGHPEIRGYASGCSLAFRTDVLDRIGGYNESLWMYHDDIDLSWRARLAGYRIVLAPRSVVYHKYEFSRTMGMFRYMERNRVLFLLEHFRWRTLALLLPAFLVVELGIWGYAMVSGLAPAKARALADLLRPALWRSARDARRAAQLLRVVGDRELCGRLEGELVFPEIDNRLLRLANPVLARYWRTVRALIRW